jgi:hypothetical protein
LSPSVNYLFSLVLFENIIYFLYPLSPRKTTYKKIDKETKNRQTNKSTDKQTDNKQTIKQTSKQTEKLTEKPLKPKQTKIQTDIQQTSKHKTMAFFSQVLIHRLLTLPNGKQVFFSSKDFILICRTESTQLFVNHFPLGKKTTRETKQSICE